MFDSKQSEVRVRHREECKHVTRLTMENVSVNFLFCNHDLFVLLPEADSILSIYLVFGRHSLLFLIHVLDNAPTLFSSFT